MIGRKEKALKSINALRSVLDRLTDEAAEWINVYIEGVNYEPEIMFSCDTLRLAADIFGQEPIQVLYHEPTDETIGRNEIYVDGVTLFDLIHREDPDTDEEADDDGA